MRKYRGIHLIRSGFIGCVLVVLVIAVGLGTERLVSWATSVRYQAVFSEAGGLVPGNDVTKLGLKVGSVTGVSLERGKVLVTFIIKSGVRLGSATTAHIRTGTLLGERVLTLESSGSDSMRPNDVIPVTRTSSPYSLSEAVSDVTTNIAGTDTTTLNQTLDQLSAVIDQIAPELGPTFDGLTRLSRALNARNDTLGDLLKSSSDVAGILSERSEQVNTLILDANALTGVLNDQRQAIIDLLANTSAVAKQLSGLTADNKEKLAPTLARLNSVTAMLEENRDNIGKLLPGLAKYQVTQGETVANGPYYTAFVPSLPPAHLLQPFFDYAFGFRRGVNAGQPPDNIGPRAEFPFPANAIPGG